MKNEVAFKCKTCMQRLTFTLTKHPLCHSGQCCYYVETSRLIYGANQWDDFYTLETLD